MKFIENKYIPFGDFGLMNILGLVFTKRPENEIDDESKCHEGTHTCQQYELLTIASIVALILCNIYASWWYLLAIPFIPFAIYIMGFLAELCIPPYHNAKKYFSGKTLREKINAIPSWFKKIWVDAYMDNCFEREAYMNQNNPIYNSIRPWCSWVFYIIPKKGRQG